MKKLMIAAAVAAMVGGAFADAIVYDVKISGKKAVTARGKVQVYAQYYTGKDDKDGNAISKYAYFSANDGEKVCYRKSGSFSFAGVLAGCDCDEYTAVGGFSNLDGTPQIAAIWDTKAKAEVPAQFLGVDFIRSGAKTEFVESYIGLGIEGGDFWLDLMGQGKFDVKKALLTNLSGNFTGALPIETIKFTEEGEECTMCKPGADDVDYECMPYEIALCDLFGDDQTEKADVAIDLQEGATECTFAYGTWSLKYNASKSKKMANITAKDNVFKAADIEKALGFPKYVKTIDFPVVAQP
jgi:hypothetical protein